MKLPPRSQKRNIKRESEKIESERLCINCALASFVEDFHYRNIEGEYILLQCKHKEFKFLRKNKACDKYREK